MQKKGWQSNVYSPLKSVWAALDKTRVMTCVDWSFHPSHKLLSSTCCVPGLYPRAHAGQNPITKAKRNAEQYNTSFSVKSTFTGSIKKGFLREESQYLRLTLKAEMGLAILNFFFFFFYLCPYVFIIFSLKTYLSSVGDKLNYSRDRRF